MAISYDAVYIMNLSGYSRNTAETLFAKFFYNSGEVKITDDEILIRMEKKRNLPALLTK
jgi:hypothetical protein